MWRVVKYFYSSTFFQYLYIIRVYLQFTFLFLLDFSFIKKKYCNYYNTLHYNTIKQYLKKNLNLKWSKKNFITVLLWSIWMIHCIYTDTLSTKIDVSHQRKVQT